ncbi:GPI mannosyltransferase 3 [Nilaparvata lugens]|uniref:GPI mannosyltransferase 3 n=1 Tax=Nilaparvata lugens TaxID=108931 RepID=UPI00193D2803|nr:GPI mannosyltransferase 3 [Nilaparvata lugens]
MAKRKVNSDFDFEKVLLVLSLVRILSIYMIQTSFVPDEYWQSLEIAHKMVFGYGYTTWEWVHGIRSFFYPLWFAGAYKFIEIFGLDSRKTVIYLPRYMQAIFSAYADTCVASWFRFMLGPTYKSLSSWVSLLWMMCLFVSYCSTRTLSNTIELNFTIIALYLYPWSLLEKKEKTKSLLVESKMKSRTYLWFVGLACLSRPTSAIIWLPLCFYDIAVNSKPFLLLTKVYLIIFLKVFVSTILIDTFFYKKIVITPLNFFLYNFSYNIGIHYGAHSFFWYVTVGIPVVLGPLVLPFYQEIYSITFSILSYLFSKYWNHQKTLMKLSNIDLILYFTVMWTLFCYSLVPHKEFRFILPLAPIMFYISALHFKKYGGKNITCFIRNSKYVLVLSLLMLLSNFIGSFYLGQWHQIGPLDTISILAEEASSNSNKSSFLFLMPCHSTPLYSHLHVNVTTKFLTCEPNFQRDPVYKDEADLFFEYPSGWLHKNYPKIDDCSLPSHIIMFSNLKIWIDDFLSRYRYTLWKSVFHAHFTQGKQSENIEIYKLNWTKPIHCFP